MMHPSDRLPGDGSSGGAGGSDGMSCFGCVDAPVIVCIARSGSGVAAVLLAFPRVTAIISTIC